MVKAKRNDSGPFPASEYRIIDIDEIQPHPANPREGDIGAIIESIQTNGFFGAILSQKSSGYIIAGAHRWRAAKQLGFKKVPNIVVDCDDATALRIVLVDNRTSDLATYDNARLVELLREFGDFTGTGYDRDDLDELMAMIAPTEGVEPASGEESEGEGRKGPRFGIERSNTVMFTFGEVFVYLPAAFYERFQAAVLQAGDVLAVIDKGVSAYIEAVS